MTNDDHDVRDKRRFSVLFTNATNLFLHFLAKSVDDSDPQEVSNSSGLMTADQWYMLGDDEGCQEALDLLLQKGYPVVYLADSVWIGSKTDLNEEYRELLAA